MGKLDGKVALITGGARGMGASHVRHFVEQGAEVVLGDMLDEEGEKLATEFGDAVTYVHHDVTSESDWDAVVQRAVSAYGKIDVLVNNAGVLKVGSMAGMSVDAFRSVMDINATGQWLGIRAVTEPMRAAGGGSIVNVSSAGGFQGSAGMSAYTASKFAVRGITRCAALELGPYGIRVNSVHPGGVATPMTSQGDVSEGRESGEYFSRLPVPRIGRPIEVSYLVAFLASDEAAYCTGAEYPVDGGMLAGDNY